MNLIDVVLFLLVVVISVMLDLSWGAIFAIFLTIGLIRLLATTERIPNQPVYRRRRSSDGGGFFDFGGEGDGGGDGGGGGD